MGGFSDLTQIVSDSVHSGSARTALNDNNTDYYPVPLTASAAARTVFADPYGHVLVIVPRLPQTDRAGGVILAVDGQPDGTVAAALLAGQFSLRAGSRAREPRLQAIPAGCWGDGALRRLSNAEIAKSPDYGDLSIAQSGAVWRTFMTAWTT